MLFVLKKKVKKVVLKLVGLLNKRFLTDFCLVVCELGVIGSSGASDYPRSDDRGSTVLTINWFQ